METRPADRTDYERVVALLIVMENHALGHSGGPLWLDLLEQREHDGLPPLMHPTTGAELHGEELLAVEVRHAHRLLGAHVERFYLHADTDPIQLTVPLSVAPTICTTPGCPNPAMWDRCDSCLRKAAGIDTDTD